MNRGQPGNEVGRRLSSAEAFTTGGSTSCAGDESERSVERLFSWAFGRARRVSATHSNACARARNVCGREPRGWRSNSFAACCIRRILRAPTAGSFPFALTADRRGNWELSWNRRGGLRHAG